jgi:predicted CoA-substrate-specific enzyme activase
MISAGIDIGSRTVKLVVLEDSQIILSRRRENSFDPLSVCRELLEGVRYDKLIATGYGRHLAKEHLNCEVITEIKAFALGVRASFPGCRTILDIGGQDIKAISLDGNGGVRKFEMNDKCSAGTGRFLEIMAMVLGAQMSEFGNLALKAELAEKINSTCTVFAESEVISMLSRRAMPEEIAMGIHLSVASKAKSMLSRVSVEDDLVFVGGVALNPCVVKMINESIGKTVHVPQDPQNVGAYGCAILGMNY